MLNAVHAIERRMGAIEDGLEVVKRDAISHREDDRLAFAGVHTAVDDLGASLTRQMSSMIGAVQIQVDTLTKDKIEAAAYARGVKDARTPGPVKTAIIQGMMGPITTLFIGIVISGVSVWLARDFWEGPHHHETTATSIVTVTRPAK